MKYPALTDKAITVSRFEQLSEHYLRSQMLAGKIIDRKTSVTYENGLCRLLGTYNCTENIGRIVYEGRMNYYG